MDEKLGSLKKLDVRNVWANESSVFTPWRLGIVFRIHYITVPQDLSNTEIDNFRQRLFYHI